MLTGGGQGIRWDRVGRMGLLAVLVVMGLLYVGPVNAYVAARGEATTKRAEVAKLRAQNDALRARRAAISHVSTLEAEARKLGMVKPGERTFIVKGLPGGE